jgi:aryl-alcohol dehydrogenase-like predicted oxidoreductase
MLYRKLGRTGIEISEIGFGTWGIGGSWGIKDDEAAVQAMRRAFDLGVNFFDTALGYGNGHSENLIGKTFKQDRHKVVIASKIPTKTAKWPVFPHEPLQSTFPK